MAYTLNKRQVRSYTEEVTFYGGDLQAGAASDGGAKDPSVPSAITGAANIPALLRQSPQNVDVGPLGRSNVDIAMTLDKLKIPVGVAVRDAQFFKLVGPASHPDLNTWWALQGNARVTPSRGSREANEQVFFCKPVPDPTV